MRTNTRIQYSRSTSRQQRLTLKPNKNEELDESQDSTQPQPSRVPQPILQTKIRKTHCNIQQLPQCMRAQTIQQLYLSHNRIKSVKHKLRLFTSLKNLNLSYNLLNDVEEFVGEICGAEQDSRPRVSIGLRMLYLRMNQFGYGYEDVVIRAISTLERFQDYTFSKPNTIDSKGKQNPKQVFQMAQRVSQYFLPAFYRLNQSIEQLHQLHSFLECCRTPENLLPQISKEEVIRKYERCVSELSMMIQPKKQIKYLPTNRMQALLIILKFEVICIKLKIKNRTDQINKSTFEEVVREIILGFSQRNYHHFINTLKCRAHLFYNIKQASNSEFALQQLIIAFGETYGGRKYSIFQNNPGKYLHKIGTQLVENHPFYDYIKENNDDYRQEKPMQQSRRIGSETLDGNRRKSKNTVYRRVENYVEHQLENQNNDYLPNYQNLPIVVYERNYLQILEQIMVAKIKSLIRMYDLVTNELVEYQNRQGHHKENRNYISNSKIIIKDNQDSLDEGYREIKSRKKSGNVYHLDSDAYLYESDNQTNLVQTPIFCQAGNAGGQLKKELVNKAQQIKIKQNKWVSEQLKQINIGKNNDMDTRQYQARLSPESEQNRKTIPKFARNLATASHDPIISQSHDYKVQMKNFQQEDVIGFKQNLGRYSIYEINLAYKVFVALKKKVKRAKRKKAKTSINAYVKDTAQPTMENTQRGSNNATKQLKKPKLM